MKPWRPARECASNSGLNMTAAGHPAKDTGRVECERFVDVP
jgi:hypothetical protein